MLAVMAKWPKTSSNGVLESGEENSQVVKHHESPMSQLFCDAFYPCFHFV